MPSNVKLNVTGLPPGKATGVTITYQVGQIPVASVDLAPPGLSSDLRIAEGFGDIDGLKRKGEVTIDILVGTYAGNSGNTIRKLKFTGLFDGMTIGNMVGGNTYQAIVKNKAQTLLELTTITPGLYPTSINIFKNPSYQLITGGDEENAAVKTWNNAEAALDLQPSFKKPVIEFYTDLMLWIIKRQYTDWKSFTGRDKMADGALPFEAIYNDPRYKKALAAASKLFSTVDFSAVSGGTATSLRAGRETVSKTLAQIFKQGPNVFLENYKYFLSQLGCTIIFSNSKMYVVPDNSVIKPAGGVIGKGQLQTKPNKAGPADYNSYMYNDNGYRDIAHVMVQLGSYAGGIYLGDLSFERGVLATYSDKELSQASGVLIVEGHPWLALSPTTPLAVSGKEAKPRLDQKSDSMHNTPTKFDDGAKQVKESYVQGSEKAKAAFEAVANNLRNYAETKFYQARFTDRHGSLTMDFNPNWVPGTGGSLYVRETKMIVAFYVTNVTHRVEVSAPNHGSAITVVNFSCGRMGEKPKGTDSDSFLGYTAGKELAVQSKFIADNM
jgi:hypothetical protein